MSGKFALSGFGCAVIMTVTACNEIATHENEQLTTATIRGTRFSLPGGFAGPAENFSVDENLYEFQDEIHAVGFQPSGMCSLIAHGIKIVSDDNGKIFEWADVKNTLYIHVSTKRRNPPCRTFIIGGGDSNSRNKIMNVLFRTLEDVPRIAEPPASP